MMIKSFTTPARDKEILIQKYNLKPTRYKALRLFQLYGADLPGDVIAHVQSIVDGIANNVDDNGKAEPYNNLTIDDYSDVVDYVHSLIGSGIPKGEAYGIGADIRKIGTRAFINKYKKRYPTETL